MIESGMPGFEVNGWYGFVYPAGVPGDVITRSHKALTEVLSRDAVRKQLGEHRRGSRAVVAGAVRQADRRGGGPLARRGEDRRA